MKTALRQRQAHCPAIKIVHVKIGIVVCWFFGVISFDKRVVCLCVPFAHHRDTSPHPPLDEQEHVQICQHLQLDTCLLQERVPTQTWRAVIMCRVKPVFFLAHLPEVLKHIRQQENICGHVQTSCVCAYSSSVMPFPLRLE